MRTSTTKDRIQILLDTLGISQNELAKNAGLNRATLCRIISGEREPSSKTIVAITDAYSISPNWLLGYGPDKPIVKI
jgi:transcriptional regulator with XRE-family HTH domain